MSGPDERALATALLGRAAGFLYGEGGEGSDYAKLHDEICELLPRMRAPLPPAEDPARLRAALAAVAKADCCGCSVYGKIAAAALAGEELPTNG